MTSEGLYDSAVLMRLGLDPWPNGWELLDMGQFQVRTDNCRALSDVCQNLAIIRRAEDNTIEGRIAYVLNGKEVLDRIPLEGTTAHLRPGAFSERWRQSTFDSVAVLIFRAARARITTPAADSYPRQPVPISPFPGGSHV